MISIRSSFCACLSLLLIGCATESKDTAIVESSQPKSVVFKSLDKYLSKDGGFNQDADGNWVSKSNKRSSFELQRDNSQFNGEFKKKAYKAGDYKKKSWWGEKSYEVSEYKGDKDGSRFKIQAESRGKETKYMEKRVPTGDAYQTNKLAYGTAKESDAKSLDKPRNDYVESRQRKTSQPTIIDWEEQRDLSLEESRGILGR
jgi:hypothetical protein